MLAGLGSQLQNIVEPLSSKQSGYLGGNLPPEVLSRIVVLEESSRIPVSGKAEYLTRVASRVERCCYCRVTEAMGTNCADAGAACKGNQYLPYPISRKTS